MNFVILTGRLGADPEQCFTGAGREVSNFRIATSQYWHDKEGKPNQKTQWHNIVAWGKTATAVGKYLTKGRLVTVTGMLSYRKWTDRDGKERWSTEIEAKNIEFLDSGKDKSANSQAVHASNTAEPMSAEASNADVPEASIPQDDQYAQEASNYMNNQDVTY